MGSNNHTDARATAKANGAMFYETGLPCRNGHVSPRRTINGRCVACVVAIEQSEIGRARDRAKYLRTADRVKARAGEWKAANPERARAANVADFHNRRARVLGIPGTLTLEDVLDVLSFGSCVACGSEARPTIDHRTCLTKGGENTRVNLQRLCLPCNSQKHTSSMDEFMARRAA